MECHKDRVDRFFMQARKLQEVWFTNHQTFKNFHGGALKEPYCVWQMFHHFSRWFYFYPCKSLDKEAWDKDSETSNNILLDFLFPILMNIYPSLKNWKRETMCEHKVRN